MNDMNETPIDLSALDAAASPEHWDAFVHATLARAGRVLDARAASPAELIASWSRPLLLAAAALVALLVPVELVLERREQRVDQIERLVSLSAGGQFSGHTPSGSEIVHALTTGTLR